MGEETHQDETSLHFIVHSRPVTLATIEGEFMRDFQEKTKTKQN